MHAYIHIHHHTHAHVHANSHTKWRMTQIAVFQGKRNCRRGRSPAIDVNLCEVHWTRYGIIYNYVARRFYLLLKEAVLVYITIILPGDSISDVSNSPNGLYMKLNMHKMLWMRILQIKKKRQAYRIRALNFDFENSILLRVKLDSWLLS